MKICAQCKNSFEEGIAYCPNDGARLTTISKMQMSGQAVPQEAVQHAAQIRADEGIEDLTGRTVAGRYSITRRLGEGGMGIVYRAQDTRLEKDVAIKVLKEDFARRSDVVARFTQEAKSAARIKHENVLDVTDYGQTEDGSFYIAMELLVGTDLADVLQKSNTVDPMRAVAIVIQVTRALSAAHAKGIVHRDLKPENIFLIAGDDAREVVKIVDFGIAQMKDLSGGGGVDNSRKLTRTGMIFGTPEYMSPEQAAGKAIDHRVDIYATGVIMYEMLAGRVPFVGDTFMGVLTQHMFENPPPIKQYKPDANVPVELEAIINKALAKDVSHRFQSMQELTDDLVRFREGQRPSAMGAVIPGAPMRPGTGAFNAQSASAADTLTSSVGPARSSDSPTVVPGKPKSNRTVPIVAAAAVLLLAIGGVAVARNLGNAHPAVTPDPNGTHTGVGGAVGNGANPVANNGNAAAGHGVPTPDPNAVNTVTPTPPPSDLRVHVVSEPAGAHVEVDGMTDRVCASTPCDLSLPRGREVRLVATAPHKHGEQTFTAQQEGETVTVQLASAARTGGGGGGGAARQNSGGNGGGNHGGHARCNSNGMRVDPTTGLMIPCFLGGH